jgi:hypothetical protein
VMLLCVLFVVSLVVVIVDVIVVLSDSPQLKGITGRGVTMLSTGRQQAHMDERKNMKRVDVSWHQHCQSRSDHK